MRPQVRLGPDALDRGDADAGPSRHPSRAPVAGAIGRWLEGERDDSIPSRPVIGWLATRPVGIGQTGQTIALEPSAPQQDRHLVDRQVGRTVQGLVERPGLARAEDFTEIAFKSKRSAR